jgi:hypothetical protein
MSQHFCTSFYDRPLHEYIMYVYSFLWQHVFGSIIAYDTRIPKQAISTSAYIHSSHFLYHG